MFKISDTFVGTEDKGLVLLEVRGYVPLGVGKGLPALESLGDKVPMCTACFKVLAEDTVVANLESLYTCGFSLQTV